MNKKDCLQEIRNRKLLQVAKTIDGNKITLTIELGDKVMKQSQLEILLAKMDEGFTEVNTKIDEVKTDVKEIKVILKKHDDLFVDHGWLNKSSF